MDLKKCWEEYQQETEFNYSVLPSKIKEKGRTLVFQPRQFIISRGEFPKYLYFIKSGRAMGTRNYSDGNEYNYFLLDHTNGCLGLLEIFARENAYVASIICLSQVEVIQLDAGLIYSYVMEHEDMLRRCLTLVASDLYQRSANDGLFYYLNGLNRVRYYFIDYYNAHKHEKSDRVVVEAEYRDIATSVGISVRTVGRSIRKLKDAQEILSKDKKIILTKEKYEMLISNLVV